MTSLKLLPVLSLIALAFLSACVGGNFKDLSTCPPWPYAGPDVAANLEALPLEGNAPLWEWLGRLTNLKDQLDLC